MCEHLSPEDVKRYQAQHGFNRRAFLAAMAAVGVGVTLGLPMTAQAFDVSEVQVSVPTPDGIADCYFVHPTKGQYPGVILWPDILGRRPVFEMMAKRLAQSGYAVLVVNPFYRDAVAPVVGEGAQYSDETVRNHVTALNSKLTEATHVSDSLAFAQFLDAQPAVDKARKLGSMGYCFSGKIVMRGAAAMPARMGAVAAFHANGLATDQSDSPHLQVGKSTAQYLIAVAEDDDARTPDEKVMLKQAFDKAGLKSEVEVYTGALHSWTHADAAVYNHEQAERAWGRLLATFESALK